MQKPETNTFVLFFLAVAIALAPFWSVGFFSAFDATTGDEFASAAAAFLSPTNFYYSIKQNFSPSTFGNSTLSPQKLKETVLQYPSSKIQNVNKGVEEETGINLPKFLRWVARIIGAVFSFFGDLMKKIGGV